LTAQQPTSLCGTDLLTNNNRRKYKRGRQKYHPRLTNEIERRNKAGDTPATLYAYTNMDNEAVYLFIGFIP
jgi:hypothetical protein